MYSHSKFHDEQNESLLNDVPTRGSYSFRNLASGLNPHHKANQLARYISRIRCKDTKILWNFQIMDKKFYILLFCRSSLVSQPIISRSSRYPFSIQDKMPLITQNCASSGRDCTNSQALVPLVSVVAMSCCFCSSVMSDKDVPIIQHQTTPKFLTRVTSSLIVFLPHPLIEVSSDNSLPNRSPMVTILFLLRKFFV